MNAQLFERAAASLPKDAADIIRRWHKDPGFNGIIEARQANDLATTLATTVDEILLTLVPLAAVFAHPVISHYAVGAVCLAPSGRLYFGANLEIPAVPLSATLHAEQAAAMNAWLHTETSLWIMALPAPSCGHCRQFLYEIDGAANLKLFIKDSERTSLATLLPHPFGPRELGKNGALMRSEQHPIRLVAPSTDPLVLAALDAAKASYAQYTESYSGAALLTQNGRMYVGRYAENAAYNPSVNPIVSALSQLCLAGGDFSEVRRAVLVQLAEATVCQTAISEAILREIAPVQLEVHLARA